MENINKDEKPQNDPVLMKKLLVDNNMSIKEVSNLLHVSKKLVAIKAKEFGLK